MEPILMHAKCSKTLTTYHCKAFHTKTTQELRTRVEFPTSKRNENDTVA